MRAFLAVVLVAILWVLVVVGLRGCADELHRDDVAAQAVWDTLEKSLAPVESDIDSIVLKQDTLIRDSRRVAAKLKNRPTVEHLLPNRLHIRGASSVSTNDSVTFFRNYYYDSVRNELIYQKMLNDSLLNVNNELCYTVVALRSDLAAKDSIYGAEVTALLDTVTKDKEEINRLKKNGFWKGFKVGFVAGKAETYLEYAVYRALAP